MEKLSKVVLIIPAIITAIGILIKFSYNFFLESLKSTYKRVPAQQSTIGIILKILFNLVIFIDLVGGGFLIVALAISIKSSTALDSSRKLALSDFYPVSSQLILLIIVVLTLLYLVHIFNKFREQYISKLKGGYYEKIGTIRICSNYILVSIYLVLTLILVFCVIFKISSGIILKSNNGMIIFQSNLTENDYTGILLIIILGMLCGFVYTISLSLLEVIKEINGESIYYIIKKNEVISCKCYLEFKNYYLILQNNVERYIKIEEVIEIKKINEKHKISLLNKIKYSCISFFRRNFRE